MNIYITWEFVQEEELIYAFVIKGIVKRETILRYRDSNVLIAGAFFYIMGYFQQLVNQPDTLCTQPILTAASVQPPSVKLKHGFQE